MKPKRLISLLVAVCMMITMLPLSAVTAFAYSFDSSWVDDPTADDGTYKYAYEENEDGDGDTVTITKFLGPVGSANPVDSANPDLYDIKIPATLGGHTVTGLGDHSFAAHPISYQDNYENPLCSNIHSVTIPQSVTSIGREAFCYCKNLQSLTLEGDIESMGDGAFAYCASLKTFPLVGNIKKIGNNTFRECSALTEVTIPQSVTSIGDYAFYYCDVLGNVTIPQGITSIGDSAFENCNRLKLTTPSFGEKLQTIGDSAFRNCFCPSEEVTIPQSVTSIGRSAFSGCYAVQSFTINDAATSIGDFAFYKCWDLTTLKLGEHITTIGDGAFEDCHQLDNVTIPQSVTSIGDQAFYDCRNLSTITIPEKVEKIESKTFDDCKQLESITLPAGLTSFQASLKNCPTDCVIYFNNDEHTADKRFGSHDVLKGRKLLCRCNVTFDANGGTLTNKGGNPTDHAVVSAYKTEKINADDLKAIPDPTRAGYKFTGWYTEDGNLFNVKDTAITEDITLHAGWEPAPKAPVCHPLTLKDGVITSVTVTGKNGADPEDITEIVKKNANEDGSFNVPEGATVSVAFDKDAFADSGLKFGHWDITGLDDPNAYQNKESFDFVMPAKAVTLKAMTQDASIEDDEPDIVGPIVIGTTVVVGGAVLGYQAYSLGAEFAGKLMALPYFPSNRSALAMMLWEDAGKPMPESELLYPDVGQEERDMDLQHAARWAMENELIPDLNDEGTAPEEMKFFPANPVSKLDVLNAWQKAQELKNN